MDDISFTSDIRVELIRAAASDADVVHAARVSTLGDSVMDMEVDPNRDRGLINFLIKNRHGSPLEHTSFTFRVTAPIFVWREHMRHRMMSYNEESGRYREMNPEFYVPNLDRPIVQVGKPGEYRFEFGTEAQYDLIDEAFYVACADAYMRYVDMLEHGIAREVARMVLPLNIMSTAYVTANARSLMNFLSLRTTREDSYFPSFPQREIEMVAEEYEKYFAEAMPMVYEAFVMNGRVSP